MFDPQLFCGDFPELHPSAMENPNFPVQRCRMNGMERHGIDTKMSSWTFAHIVRMLQVLSKRRNVHTTSCRKMVETISSPLHCVFDRMARNILDCYFPLSFMENAFLHLETLLTKHQQLWCWPFSIYLMEFAIIDQWTDSWCCVWFLIASNSLTF